MIRPARCLYTDMFVFLCSAVVYLFVFLSSCRYFCTDLRNDFTLGRKWHVCCSLHKPFIKIPSMPRSARHQYRPHDSVQVKNHSGFSVLSERETVFIHLYLYVWAIENEGFPNTICSSVMKRLVCWIVLRLMKLLFECDAEILNHSPMKWREDI